MKFAVLSSETIQASFLRGLLGPGRLMAGALLALATVTSGCGGGQAKIDTMSNLKELSLAAIQYHETNKVWPDKLDDLKSMIGKDGPLGKIGKGKDYAALVANPMTGDNPGYEYVKPNETDKGTTTIIVYQLKGGKRDESLSVAFKDGSVRDAKNSP